MNRAVALLFALALVVTACGDDDATDNTGAPTPTDAASSAVINELQQEILAGADTGSDIPLDDAQALCFASGLVGEFGAEAMGQAVQMEFEEFMAQATPAERLIVVDTMLGCVDFTETMAGQFDGAISAEAATCLSDSFIGSDAFRTALANSFGSADTDPFEDPALVAEMLPAMLECLTAEELLNLGSDD